jgi:arylsulfatase A-like enzyme
MTPRSGIRAASWLQVAGVFAVVLGMLAAGLQRADAQTFTRPNIVAIMLDDYDWATLARAVGGGVAPNIKRYLMDEGYTFTNSFTTSTFGSPTRATFLTGQYPHNHGEIGGDPTIGAPFKLNQNATIATWLRTGGYRTALAGRYLTGYGLFTAQTYIPPGWDEWYGLVDPTTWSTSDYVINANGTLIDVGAAARAANTEIHQTDLLTYLTVAFVLRAPSYGRPFFLHIAPIVFNRERFPGPSTYNVCPDDPTSPFTGTYWGIAQRPPSRYLDTIFGNTTDFALPQPPSFNEADMSDKPNWAQANPLLTDYEIGCLQKRYWRKLEAIRAVDDMVGQLMSALQSTGAIGNTVVMLTADAGDVDGQHRFPEKMPAFEETYHVPLLIRAPGNTTPKVISKLVLNTDLAPTIAHMALVSPTITMDGRSLVPLLQNSAATWRKLGLFEHATTELSSLFSYPPSYLALRTDAPARMFVRYPSITNGLNGELYDLGTDPYQLQNVYTNSAYQAEVTRLTMFMYYMRFCMGTGCGLIENAY